MTVQLQAKIVSLWRLMRFDKPIGILLLLWPALWALWVAGDGHPPWLIVGIFVAGVIVMRAAGCIVNDLADRKYDGLVARTKQRPLVIGSVTAIEAVALFSFLLLIALSLVLILNILTLCFSVGALILTMIYPLMKRWLQVPQLVLGFAFAWSVPMAFTAVTGGWPTPVAWAIFAATLLWVVAYDTQYAMVDRSDDLKAGIKSTAILFGRFDRFVIGLLQMLSLSVLLFVGLLIGKSIFFFFALLCVLLLLVYQQALIKDRDPALCFKAFMNNQWVGLVLFLGIFFG
jgi:4-hydroxybenzoate polyprenyltransferase